MKLGEERGVGQEMDIIRKRDMGRDTGRDRKEQKQTITKKILRELLSDLPPLNHIMRWCNGTTNCVFVI